uniref:Hemagglutinin n=1 Tax=Heterorhabditis bacteriophora TaxID=37862 RepID=A0A1I7XV59_HETBA
MYILALSTHYDMVLSIHTINSNYAKYWINSTSPDGGVRSRQKDIASGLVIVRTEALNDRWWLLYGNSTYTDYKEANYATVHNKQFMNISNIIVVNKYVNANKRCIN